MNKDLDKIVTVMKQTHGRDISVYDQSFLLKSLEKRLIATGVNTAELYCSCLEENTLEADTFFNSLTITFSQFFRDPLTFTLLEQLILPGLIRLKADEKEIRIWSAGCSSGQEAYSLAMLLSDLAETGGKEINFRIFATDISQEAIAAGRAGVYDQNAVLNVKLKYLDKYFTKNGTTYTIVPQLRQCISFSTYNLLDLSTANPPESIYGDFDIVMCSNLLFYYKLEMQKVIIKKMLHAMSATGHLVTGEAEKTLIKNATKLQMIAIPTAVFKLP
ncbi:MAG: protein-glutamate O-methyltransferase CheR [Bacillota bacterium]|nr:protein-glutamate O-methyltransferase CheR [Bacillota bacterium]